MLATGLACHTLAAPIGTAFTYQGQLAYSNSPVTGSYDFNFAMFDAATDGSQISTNVWLPAQLVTNGYFTVALDFGAVFDGNSRWLEISTRVHPTGFGLPAKILSPRQPITPAPYALLATGLNGLRIQASTNGGPSVIGGSSLNSVLDNVAGATIAGGGAANFAGLGHDYINTVTASFGTVGGGGNNRSSGSGFSTVGGGGENTSSGYNATVAGGGGNLASGNGSTVAGGFNNTSAGYSSAIGGGAYNTNTAAASHATIPGGQNNSVSAPGGMAAGRDAHVNYAGSFVWGDGSRSAYSAGVNRFDVLATGGATFYTGTGSLTGVEGDGTAAAPASTGVYGVSLDSGGNGIVGEANVGGNAYAIWGKSGSGYAGFFDGKVQINGDATVGGVASLNFGSNIRQMLNLYSSSYGIGVQNNAEYYRSSSDFYWFKGGSHSNTQGEPGLGGTNLMHLDGAGTLYVKVLAITGGADVAEPFQMSDQGIAKGSVVIIDDAHPGKLKLSERAYDRRVAGIVSGANGINPGLSLSQHGALEGGQNVALSGRVYVQADASHGAIQPGDLLTTSDTPGYAMKATDYAQAQGAILGKAMSGLSEGKGLVLVLVTLQ